MTHSEILHAAQMARARMGTDVRRTPLEVAYALSEQHGAYVTLKLENLQSTGSFKLRGALAKISTLPQTALRQGIVTASSGNHGAAVAYAVRRLGGQARVFVPHHAPQVKCDAIARYGARVERHSDDGLITELYARQYALERGQTYISPYNDPLVIAGQGTIGLEIIEDLPDVDAVFVTVGGGGLISGVAGVLKTLRPTVRVIGCQPENDAAMLHAIRAGSIVDVPGRPTISDGSAGGIEPEAITFPLCQTLVDDWVTVSETEIIAQMRAFMQTQHQLLEGAAGVALAAYVKVAEAYRNRRVCILICGAKISLHDLRRILTDP